MSAPLPLKKLDILAKSLPSPVLARLALYDQVFQQLNYHPG